MGSTDIDAFQLVREIRDSHRSVRWTPPIQGRLDSALNDSLIQAHPGLDFLHRNWALPRTSSLSSGSIRSRLNKLVSRFVFTAMSGYLSHEQDLLSNVVRLNDALAKRCDELARAHNHLVDQLNHRSQVWTKSQSELALQLEHLSTEMNHISPTGTHVPRSNQVTN